MKCRNWNDLRKHKVCYQMEMSRWRVRFRSDDRLIGINLISIYNMYLFLNTKIWHGKISVLNTWIPEEYRVKMLLCQSYFEMLLTLILRVLFVSHGYHRIDAHIFNLVHTNGNNLCKWNSSIAIPLRLALSVAKWFPTFDTARVENLEKHKFEKRLKFMWLPWNYVCYQTK